MPVRLQAWHVYDCILLPGSTWCWRARKVASVGQRRRVVAAASVGAAVAGVALSLSGCGQMDAALSRQWMVVEFSPQTSAATAMHVRAACSHIQNTPPLPLPAKSSVINVMYGVRFDTTNSTPANLAELQLCLQKFKSVLGINAQDTGGQGS